jgi:hypothetical protein
MKHTDFDWLNIFIYSKTSASLAQILYIVVIKIIVTSIQSRSSIFLLQDIVSIWNILKKSNKWIKEILAGFFINDSYRRINPKKLVFHNFFSFASTQAIRLAGGYWGISILKIFSCVIPFSLKILRTLGGF